MNRQDFLEKEFLQFIRLLIKENNLPELGKIFLEILKWSKIVAGNYKYTDKEIAEMELEFICLLKGTNFEVQNEDSNPLSFAHVYAELILFASDSLYVNGLI